MTVDFHVHSTASDGTVSPAGLYDRAVRGGFAVLALTDHDNLDGVPELLAAAETGRSSSDASSRPRIVPGVELSIDPGAGFDRFHLLALGVDASNAGLKAYLARILEGRNARNVRIVENFRRLGIDLGADIASYAHGDVLARPHFARWLVEHGKAADIPDAFARYLLPDSPSATRCYEERWHPPQEETFRVVHAAGGLCVMAHPRYWRRAWKTVGCDFAAAARELQRLREIGLDGIEALYEANTLEENLAFSRLADELGFLKSAGSDFHGANKPTISLGMDVPEEFVRPLLERLPGRS